MLNDSEWQSLKIELIKVFSEIFRRSGYIFSCSLEECLDLFRATLEWETSNPDLDGREDIETALKNKYVAKDGREFSTSMATLVTKFESFLKRVFAIIGLPIGSGQGMLKSCIVTFVKALKDTLGDPDFQVVNDAVLSNGGMFFAQNAAHKPRYRPEDMADKLPFGKQLKSTYDMRNAEGHTEPELSEEEVITRTKDAVTCYIFVVWKLAEKLKPLLKYDPASINSSKWSQFEQYSHHFDKNQLYFLIADKLTLNSAQLSHFTNIDW
jgi:hypothetical protein